MTVGTLQLVRVCASGRPTDISWVSVEETERGNILLDANFKKPILRPDEARELARQLYRLVRRVRKRSLPEETT